MVEAANCDMDFAARAFMQILVYGAGVIGTLYAAKLRGGAIASPCSLAVSGLPTYAALD